MLDEFLKVAYDTSKREKEKRAFIDGLKKLPREELFALANGEKTAWLDTPKCSTNDVNGWLEQFKGTPLFEQAVQLEQAELQLEAARIQQQMSQPPERDTWVQQDQVRLQKRLLELTLAQQSAGGAHMAAAPQPASPPAPELAGSQGAGAVGAEELDNTEAVHNRPAGSPGLKMSSAEFGEAKAKMTKAASMLELARGLARADGEKLALSLPPGLGGAASRVFSKLGPQGTKALIGAGVGAAGGALATGHDRDGWHPGGMLAGALGGAALGGAAGHVGGNVAAQMARGAPVSRALSTGAALSARQFGRAGQAALSEGKQLMGGLSSPKA